MNPYQALWWEQVRSDHQVLLRLREQNAAPCQQLHYLQMATEKLGKAYYWRANTPPPKSHASFVRFLQLLDNRPESDRARIAGLLGFPRAQDFKNWIPTITPLAYDVERLAPALAGGDGPNTEYPWPIAAPRYTPATFAFDVWPELTATPRGRRLLKVVDDAVTNFPQYA